MMRMQRKASAEAMDQNVDEQYDCDRHMPAFVDPNIVAAILRRVEDATTVLALTGCAGVRVEFSARALRAD